MAAQKALIAALNHSSGEPESGAGVLPTEEWQAFRDNLKFVIELGLKPEIFYSHKKALKGAGYMENNPPNPPAGGEGGLRIFKTPPSSACGGLRRVTRLSFIWVGKKVEI